ncbi:hypothetical protein [Arthrobacter sp. UYCu723]
MKNGRDALLKRDFGRGQVLVHPASGALMQFTCDEDTERRYLLDDEVLWHSDEHQWGAGFITTDKGSARWHTPSVIVIEDDALQGTFPLGDALTLTVTRTFGDVLVETYRFSNTTAEAVTVTGLGIQTPLADHYATARQSLSQAVNVHAFTGGRWAWVLAQPMNGAAPMLGLILRKGELNAYSLETRNHNTLSNARGHFVLQPTDRARSPHAFGGQPVIVIGAGEDYVVEWELQWFSSKDDFIAATNAPAKLDGIAAKVGEDVLLTTATDVSVTTQDDDVKISSDGQTHRISSTVAKPVIVRIGEQSHTEVLFHRSVQDTVVARCQYILDRQRPRERSGLLAHAFVPLDTRTGLTQTANDWSDWSDGSERIGMAVLMQRAVTNGWMGQEAADAVQAWEEFCLDSLLEEELTPHRGSQVHSGSETRLYDLPWHGQFFLTRYRHTGEERHLDIAAKLYERYFALGAEHFLGVMSSEFCHEICVALEEAGHTARAEGLKQRLVASAKYFLDLGYDLPAHEVVYEQSIVAPLVNLFIDAFEISQDQIYLDAVKETLGWLRAFGGPQPHSRLLDVPIRHWDGYWFGIERLWGDIFPHHWSALSATVLQRLPKGLRTEGTERTALSIMRSGMANYFPDGSATAAFVMPSSVDGRTAHLADPLANDQDWHLATWLWLHDRHAIDLP